MAVVMKRSTKSAPRALSTSYLIGSAAIGISMMTLNSSGALAPGVTCCRLMVDGRSRGRANSIQRPRAPARHGGVAEAGYISRAAPQRGSRQRLGQTGLQGKDSTVRARRIAPSWQLEGRKPDVDDDG